MDMTQGAARYHVWAADNAAYGPVELPVVSDWIKDERVTAGTWIFPEGTGVWAKAAEIPELQMLFSAGAQASTEKTEGDAPRGPDGIHPGNLRRIKILAELSDDELSTLLQYFEVQQFKMFEQVVRIGDHGDSIYFILSGELRARTIMDGKETILATLGVGDYFGEISLLDHGPRSADVLANSDSVLLKLSYVAFQKLSRKAPQLALHFMCGLSRATAGKIRLLTKRYQDSIHFSHYAEACG